jgi:hypothetical protein
MASKEDIDILRIELSIKMKNGVAFIIGGCISWLIIMLIWIFNKNIFLNNIFTIVGTCNKFCVNDYTTIRSKYGLFKRSSGRDSEGLPRTG